MGTGCGMRTNTMETMEAIYRVLHEEIPFLGYQESHDELGIPKAAPR